MITHRYDVEVTIQNSVGTSRHMLSFIGPEGAMSVRYRRAPLEWTPGSEPTEEEEVEPDNWEYWDDQI